jgi:CDP-glucose 4,6-dehydratase
LENLVGASLSNFDGLFKKKTFFVTGHTGFIGSWLSLWLFSLGAKVVGFSINLPTKPSLFEILSLDKHVVHKTGDINNIKELSDQLSECNPDFVLHLAAQPLVRLSYEKPIETFQTNIMGTVNLLESIRSSTSIKGCIVMTSDKCYENIGITHAYKEDDPLGGHDPYSASKGATEIITKSFRRSFFEPRKQIGLATIRAGNVIGGGDWSADRIVPDCMKALALNESIMIRHPEAVRPFQFVLEPISAILCLMAKMWHNKTDYSSAWNVGPLSSSKVTVRELVSSILESWGGGKWVDASKQSQNEPHESNLLLLDPQKAIAHLGWTPIYTVEEAVKKTVNWYRAYNENKNMFEYSRNQIDEYVKKAQSMNVSWAQ